MNFIGGSLVQKDIALEDLRIVLNALFQNAYGVQKLFSITVNPAEENSLHATPVALEQHPCFGERHHCECRVVEVNQTEHRVIFFT